MEKILIVEDRYGIKNKYFVDDDFIDRLNNRATVMGLMMCIFIITGSVYVGKPINCWTPAEFKGQHDGYANSICWLKGSYYLPTDEILIPDRSKPRINYVSYYQWTPFILLGMALLFLVPRGIWHGITRKSGLNIRRLTQTIKEKGEVELVRKTLKSYFDLQNHLKGNVCCGFRIANFYYSFTAMYFTIKILYVVNSLTQFFLLNAFLSFNFTSYGVEVLNKFFSGGDWFESRRFPRVTMCDFMVRRLGSNQHWYAVQCNLPINLFHEIIFLGIWIWLIILTILNALSIVSWIIAITRGRRTASIERYLKLNISSLISAEQIDDFDDYLHTDGFLILRIFAHNTDEMIAGQIIEHLYRNFVPRRLYYRNMSEV